MVAPFQLNSARTTIENTVFNSTSIVVMIPCCGDIAKIVSVGMSFVCKVRYGSGIFAYLMVIA
jgi:hypothetical protein